MKIKLTESQVKRILNEEGGYDDVEIMQSHAGNLQGELRHFTSETVSMLEIFINHLQEGMLEKEDIMAGIYNLSEKFKSDTRRIKELSKEIYVDDDFKLLIRKYSNSLQKVLKYFNLLSNITVQIKDGKPHPTVHGLGLDMSHQDLTLMVAQKLQGLGEHIGELGEMFNKVAGRYQKRFNQDN